MNHDGGETYTSERKQCDMTNKVKPNKHRGFLSALKTGPDHAKRLRSCLIETNWNQKSFFLEISRPCACIQPFKLGRRQKKSQHRPLWRNPAARNHSLRGMSRRSSTFECDGASAVTKVHIRNAPMSWRVNEYVRKRKSFSDCEVPESFQLRILATLLETQQIFDVRGFLLENFIQQFSNCSACRRVIFDRPVVFQLLCEMSAEQNAVSECHFQVGERSQARGPYATYGCVNKDK